MYALVANGIATVCSSYRQLQALIALYPYPKFQKVASKEEGRRWLRAHTRRVNSVSFHNYGDTATTGFVTIRYEITEEGISYQLDTRCVGFLKFHAPEGVLVCNKSEEIKVWVTDVRLDDKLIIHHLIAIRRILRMLGEFIDVNVVVPDISVYLALAKYTGKNYMINAVQRDVATRLGAVAVTIQEGGNPDGNEAGEVS